MSPDKRKSSASRLSRVVSPFFSASAVLNRQDLPDNRGPEFAGWVRAWLQEMQQALFLEARAEMHSGSSTNVLLPVSAKATLAHLYCHYVNGGLSIILKLVEFSA